MVLKENTRLKVEDFKETKQEKETQITDVLLRIFQGTGLFHVKEQPKPFKVTTNHAVTGVLGTKFSVSANANKTTVSVLDKKVSVTATSNDQSIVVPELNEVEIDHIPATSLRLTKLQSAKLQRLIDEFAEMQNLRILPPVIRGPVPQSGS